MRVHPPIHRLTIIRPARALLARIGPPTAALMLAGCWIPPALADEVRPTEAAAPAAPAAPAAIPAAKRELLENLFEICDMKAQHDAALIESFDGAIGVQAKRMPEAMNAGFEEGIAKVRKLTLDTAGWEAIKDRLLATYAAEFSEEELRAAIKAMDVPAVRDFFKKRTLLTATVARINLETAGELQAQVAEIMTEAMLGEVPEPPAAEGASPADPAAPAAAKAADEIREGIEDIISRVVAQAGLDQPTEKELAKIAALTTKYGKLVRSATDRKGKRDLEERILTELPLCFDGDRQQRFRTGLKHLMRGMQQEAKTAQVNADLSAITSALQMFKLNAGHYPTTEQGLAALVTKPERQPVPRRWIRIMEQVPKDAWGNLYRYRMPGNKKPDSPEVFSLGPDGKEGTADDVVSQ